jgi:hypothetical protein
MARASSPRKTTPNAARGRRRVLVTLERAELCALMLAVLHTQRRNALHENTRAELERARKRVARALERACEARRRA